MIAEKLSSALDIFTAKSPSLIGVDISSTSIKLVELVDAGKGVHRLERYVDRAARPRRRHRTATSPTWTRSATGLKRAPEAARQPQPERRARPACRHGDHQEDHRARPARRKRTSSSRSRPRPTSTSRSRSTRSTSTSRSLGPAPNNPDEVEVLIAASRKEKVEDRVADRRGRRAEAAGDGRRKSYATQEAFRLIAPLAAAPTAATRTSRWSTSAPTSRHFYVLAQRPIPVLPRPGVRRQPAHPRHPARIQPLARGSRVGEEESGAPGEL